MHKLRNVSNKLRQCPREPGLQEARSLYLAPTRRKTISCFRAGQSHGESAEPKAVVCRAPDLEALLVCFEVPGAHRKKLRPPNPRERVFREVRRRTNPRSCLNNHGSVERLTFIVVHHQNAKGSRKPLPEFTQKT